jgi:hypothetical protein
VFASTKTSILFGWDIELYEFYACLYYILADTTGEQNWKLKVRRTVITGLVLEGNNVWTVGIMTPPRTTRPISIINYSYFSRGLHFTLPFLSLSHEFTWLIFALFVIRKILLYRFPASFILINRPFAHPHDPSEIAKEYGKNSCVLTKKLFHLSFTFDPSQFHHRKEALETAWSEGQWINYKDVSLHLIFY